MANLLWSAEFNTPLDLKSASNPNGLWMANDFWQSPTMGYEDFAGTSFNINPNDPAFAGYNPFSVQNGYLQIEAERTPSALAGPIATEMAAQGQPGGVPAWTGGILITNPAVHTFTYGYFEFRERVDAGKGEFPAMWFYSANEGADAQGKSSAEIDLFEIFGVPNQVHTSQHGETGTEVGVINNADTGGWHTYGMNWQPNHIDFYRDGVLVYSMTQAQASFYNDLKLSIRVNFSMDAPWFSSAAHSDGTTPSHMDMQIDYIRQYDTFPGVNPPPPPGTDDTLTISAAKWASGQPIDMGGGNDTLNVVVTSPGDIHTLGAPAPLGVEHLNLYGQPGSDTLTLRGDQMDALLAGDQHIDLGGGWNIIDLTTNSLDFNNLGANDAAIRDVQQFEVGSGGVTIDMHGQTEGFKFYGQAGNDTFIGGSGHDTFTGRGGADVFGVGNGDIVNDFTTGDHLKVAANVNIAAITETFSGGNTVVHLDPTTTVLLTGIHHLTGNDFTH